MEGQAHLTSLALSRLERLTEIGGAERSALIAQMGPVRALDRKTCMERQDTPLRAVAVLVEGLACAVRTLDDGRQMNIAIYVPGDLINLPGLFAGTVRVSTFSLTAIKVMQVAVPAMTALLTRYPVLERAILRNLLIDNAIAQEWMIGMGRRSAAERLAHFLCEIFARLQHVGLAREDGCDFPLTQEVLADTLGLSVVHTNRMLQQLRGEGLIMLQHGRLVLLNWTDLKAFAGFDADYLDLPYLATAKG